MEHPVILITISLWVFVTLKLPERTCRDYSTLTTTNNPEGYTMAASASTSLFEIPCQCQPQLHFPFARKGETGHRFGPYVRQTETTVPGFGDVEEPSLKELNVHRRD